MIEFKNVCKTYENGTKALKNIDLRIEDGEFVFIVGNSGAGKTTMTKLLMREEKITSGKLIIDEFDLSRMSRYKVPRLRRTIGMVFQDNRLLRKMTAFENVAFAMHVIGEKKSVINARVKKFMEIVGLSDKLDSYPDELSGGEQQRVALARAIVNRPRMIIADEPTGNIDPNLSYEMIDLLVRINKLKITVVVITHAKEIVDRFQKRVVTIGDGMLVSDRIGGMFE